MRLLKPLAAAALATAGLLALAPAASAATVAPADPSAPVTRCTAGPFDKATVVRSPDAKNVTLIVSGVKSSSNVEIRLEPVVYIVQPDFWLIMVRQCVGGGIGLPVLTPYTVKLDVTNTLGTEGIEVQGSNQSVKIKVPSAR